MDPKLGSIQLGMGKKYLRQENNKKKFSSLFLHKPSGGIVILLIYVDDMLVTSSHVSLVSQILDSLKVDLILKDLGDYTMFWELILKRCK